MFGSLQIGDRLLVAGGYGDKPEWLGNGSGFVGRLISFIPSDTGTPSAVVQLDEPIAVQDARGDILVLALRYVGARWEKTETVHVELCDFMPAAKPWSQRRQGKCVESHANYRRL